MVANHTSYWDPVIVGCALRRQVFFMAKEELFRIPGLGQIIRWLGAFPVRRGMADRTAYRTALTLLRQGQAVGIFPEGTRSHTGALLPPQSGAAVLALRTCVPVLPVYIEGSRGLFGKVLVRVGRPLTFTAQSGADSASVSTSIMQAIECLREEGDERRNGGPGSCQGRVLLRRAAGGTAGPSGRR